MLLLQALLALPAGAPKAEPAYYVLAPYAEAGLRTAELRYWTVEPRRRPTTIWPELGFSLGLSDRWSTLLLASWIGTDGHATRLSTLNWQHTLLLTDGRSPVDLALHLQWIGGPRGRHEATEAGLLLQFEPGLSRLNLNAVLHQARGAARPELKLQWQWAWRLAAHTHAGVMGLDEPGPWNDWLPHGQQSHRLGPMFEQVWTGDGRLRTRLQAGWLAGRVSGRSGNMLTLRLSQSF